MRRGVELGVLLLGVLVGYGLAGVLGVPAEVDPSFTPEPGVRQTVEPTSTTMASTTSTIAETHTYLIWSTGGLTAELVAGLQQRFPDASIVAGDVVELSVGDGWAVPLDALAIDPTAHRPFDPDETLASLRPGTVVLGETSAEFRGAAVGDTIDISDVTYEIVGIVPDDVVGAAEIVFSRSERASPVSTDRYALVSTELPRADLETAVRALYDGPAPLRIRSEGETPWLRHGDAVLPQIFIKEALGEFSYRNLSGGRFVQSEEFLSEQVVEAEVPILGTVTCHEVVVEMLEGALGELVDEGLGHLVDASGYAGCWNPRYIRTVTGDLAGISRHAWGAAVDINAGANPMGSAGTQDPRLVEVMLEWGFTWGGDWLVPDPMHFEYGIDPG